MSFFYGQETVNVLFYVFPPLTGSEQLGLRRNDSSVDGKRVTSVRREIERVTEQATFPFVTVNEELKGARDNSARTERR